MTAIHLIHRGTESVYCGIKSANTSVHPATATCKRCAKAYTAEQRALDTDAQYVLDHADTMTEKAINQATNQATKNDDRQTCDACGKHSELMWNDDLGAVCAKCDAQSNDTHTGTTQCECSRYYYTVGAKVCTTGCTKNPSGKKSRFAQGHDQKLVSLRKAAAAAGAEIKRWSE